MWNEELFPLQKKFRYGILKTEIPGDAEEEMGKERLKKERGKVIPLVLNAEFYYQKAMQAMKKKDYGNALRYFRRTVELEPENPVNHCNLAGILAEVGRFEESNRILHYILEQLSPDFHECNLFLGHNYASMGEYSSSKKYALRYLEKEPEGEYVADAEELLEYLAEVSGEENEEEEGVFSPEFEEHEEARRLLGKGRFKAALKKLQVLVKRDPFFLPARNNLSLTYYYLGQVEAAIHEAYRVLELDPQNLHALCNLSIFFKNVGEEEKGKKLVEGLAKVYPIPLELGYKLATTMGFLQEDETAYRLFRHLYRLQGETLPLLHLLAVSAYNQNKWADAKYWWGRLYTYEEGKEIAAAYLSLLQGGDKERRLSYRYPPVLPKKEDERQKRANMEGNGHSRISLLWGLHFGDEKVKREAIELLGKLGGRVVETNFRDLLRDREEDRGAKERILAMLVQMGAPLPIEIRLGSTLFRLVSYPKLEFLFLRLTAIDRMEQIFQAQGVKFSGKARKRLRQWYYSLFYMDAERLLQIRKWEALAAALEYVLLHEQQKIGKSKLAARYGIAPATLNRYLKNIFEY